MSRLLLFLLRSLLAFALGAAATVARADFDPVNDDTDLFLANPNFTAQRPNILIILDNTANWNTPFAAEKTALVNALGSILDDKFNVGLMMFTETGAGNGGNDGGYVRFAVRQMTGDVNDSTTNRGALKAIVAGLDVAADKSNGGKAALAMAEAYRYFAGLAPNSGNNKVKADYAGNTANPLAGNLPNNALQLIGSGTYNSPITDACQRSFIIYISNGKAQDSSADLTTAQNMLTSAYGGVTPATISLSNVSPDSNSAQGNWADEWAKFMATMDCQPVLKGTQNVITYTLDIGPSGAIDPGTQGAGWTTLLKSMASSGGGKYFAIANNDPSTASQIQGALTAIFQEVQSVNSVFASTTLPVSVNVRGTNINQVYIGVFRPDAQSLPRWYGNLKLYKLALDTSTNPASVMLADSAGVKAQDSATGFIIDTATSYWTTPSGFWTYRGPAYAPDDVGQGSDAPDGNKVEKGGAAQMIRNAFGTSQDSRRMYTCTGAGGAVCAPNTALSASPFSAGTGSGPADNSNITAADVNAYLTYDVASIVIAPDPSPATSGTATVTLSTTPGNAFANGDVVRITGASPARLNGDFAISGVVGGGLTFTYAVPTMPPGNIARVTTSSAHQLNTGDLVTVSGALPAAYNVTNAPVTRISPTQFIYALSCTAGVDCPTAGAAVLGAATGSKLVAAISGSGTSATASFASAHGYTGPIGGFGITGASPAAFNVSNASATVASAASVNYTTASPLAGAGVARITTTTVHELKTGDLATITGAANGYNCTSCAISVIDANSFTYAPASSITGPLGGTPSISATRNLGNSGYTMANGTTGATKGSVTVAFTNPGNPQSLSTNWTASVTGATPTGFNVTNAAITSAPDIFTIRFPVSPGPSAGSTSSGQTLVVNRNAISTGISGTLVVTATGSPIYATTTLAVTANSVQTAATGTISAGRPFVAADADAAMRTSIINWMRGADNNQNENNDCTVSPFYPCTATNNVPRKTDIRTSVHGDVLHSRPAVVNYNRNSASSDPDVRDSDVYTFYGANDGMIHALRGGIKVAPAGAADPGVAPGTERWTFIPREFFPRLRRLRDNSPSIGSLHPKDYFGDGPIGIYQLDANGDGQLTPAGGDKVQLFLGFRRGGRFVYALDVIDPANPNFLWRKKSDGTVGGSDTGYAELGQSWSEPKVAKIKVTAGGVTADKQVLIFGGGYDPAVEDANPCLIQSVDRTSVTVKPIGTGTVDYTTSGSCSINNPTGSATTVGRQMGRAIFVVDVTDGSVIFQAGPAPVGALVNKTVAGMTCAIPSDMTVIDIGREGYADRAYVGDTCGQLWRFDFSGTSDAAVTADPGTWKVTMIGSISSSTATDVTNKRKFLFPPDVVFDSDASGAFAAVLIGSGDREHPFDTSVVNRFYMFKDRGTGTAILDSDLFDATNANGVNSSGFKVTLAAGEKVVGSAVTMSGTTFFNTNQPDSTAGGGSCNANLGVARQYLISFKDASPTANLNNSNLSDLTNRSATVQGGGFLPSPVPAVVNLGGKDFEVVISGTSVKTPSRSTLNVRSRIYWYKQLD